MKSGICTKTLTVLISFLISISVAAGANTDLVEVDEDLAFPDTDQFSDSDVQKRRLSNFVRIGRGLSSFIRIGKNGLYAPYDAVEGDNDYDNDGRANSAYPEKRISSFVRIGRGMSNPDYEKRAGAFIRVGKFPSSGYYRSRYSGNRSPYYRRTGRIGQSSFIRIGKRDTRNALNDQKTDDDLYQRYALADDSSDLKAEDKKMSSFVRIGRPSSFVRIGRPSSFVRIGRPSSFVRIGRPMYDSDSDGTDGADEIQFDDDIDKDEDKRMSKFVRIGKNKELLNDDIFKRRLSNFVRIGRQPGVNDIDSIGDNGAYRADVKRRMSSFVRIGKSGNAGEKLNVELKDESPADLQ